VFAKIRIVLSLGLIAMAASACTRGVVDATASIQSSEDAYFVIGIAPENTKVQVMQGDVENGCFTLGNSFSHVTQVLSFNTPTDGFLVVKTNHPTDTAGIGSIQFLNGGNSPGWSGPAFNPAGKSFIFKAIPGKVEYITSITFSPEAYSADFPAAPIKRTIFDGDNPFAKVPSAGFSLHPDIEAARAFLKTHYPQLTDELVQGNYEMLPYDKCH
jgi:hypothetical protein